VNVVGISMIEFVECFANKPICTKKKTLNENPSFLQENSSELNHYKMTLPSTQDPNQKCVLITGA
jgi:hypothetical protein